MVDSAAVAATLFEISHAQATIMVCYVLLVQYAHTKKDSTKTQFDRALMCPQAKINDGIV